MLISISIPNWLHLGLHSSIEFTLSHNEERHIDWNFYWLQGCKHEQNRHSLCASLTHNLRELCIIQWEWWPRSHSQNTCGTAWSALPLSWLYLTDVKGMRISWVAVLSSGDHHEIQALVHVSNTLKSSYTKQPKWLWYRCLWEGLVPFLPHSCFVLFLFSLNSTALRATHLSILILTEALFQWAIFS